MKTTIGMQASSTAKVMPQMKVSRMSNSKVVATKIPPPK
jgi:hypothetical protein